jgi:hypothetical protein
MGKGAWVIVGIVILVVLSFTIIPGGRAKIRDWRTSLLEVDEQSYEMQVKVEDEARLRVTAYMANKTEYLSLVTQLAANPTDNILTQRVSAKRTMVNNLAIQYNEFILKNSHVWKENVPADITSNLAMIN